MDLVIKNFTYTSVTDKAELISKVRFESIAKLKKGTSDINNTCLSRVKR